MFAYRPAAVGPDRPRRRPVGDPYALPAGARTEAQALLDELDDGWLRDQVVGLRMYVGVLAGETRGWEESAPPGASAACSPEQVRVRDLLEARDAGAPA